MGMGIYNIGVTALLNAQLGLATTGHNVANADTAGYTRQRIIQTTNVPTLTGSGYIGTGAYVPSVERIYDNFLSKQVRSAQTAVSALEAYATVIGELNMLLADADAGLESALEGFFTGVNQASSDPSSLTTRQTLISAAQNLTSRFGILNNQLSEQYQNVNSHIESYVDSINSYAQQIAQINRQIIDAESVTHQPPNDLYDLRDQVIAELNKVIGVQTTTNTNGSLNVFFGNGQQLVVGVSTTTLVAMPSSGSSGRMEVGVVYPGGNRQELPESLLTGGALSGVLKYRSEALDAANNSLGQIAASVALVVNAQHALGQDLLGNIDGDAGFIADFFKVGEPSVYFNTNNPAGSAIVSASFVPPSQNADGTFYTNLTGSDYQLDYDGTQWTLTRLSDKMQWSDATIAGLNTQINDESDPRGAQGFELAVDPGTLSAGLSYQIQPTRNLANTIAVNPTLALDVRQIALAAPVYASVSPANTGTAAISPGSVSPGYTLANVPVTLSYDSAANELTGFPSFPVTMTVDGAETTFPAAPVLYTKGATYTFDGISFTIGGTPSNGDEFTIARNSNGVSDNRNALLLAQMQTSKTMAGNTASFSTVYSRLVSSAGNKGGETNTVLAARKVVLSEAEKARDSVSGVNLDEEAVNLMLYQQSYQAAAKMLQIASELFNSILAIG
ncbi:MAG: flagellar hook-associated protein FlgK [Candidatus Accumulibacter sp.]|jgi:flagellar hook-associated protein 1 FlgK|nr:flagellar hook-associated protein FlgK [Accumulibacter sp.]